MNFRFVDFNENINTIVSRENYSGKNLFICPNHRSLGALQAEFQSFITFDKIGFLTMDQFKERFLSYKMPPLKEEKRTLAFYASLCVEHKEHFHINDYFQSISLANQFFPFFEELNEENVSFTTLREQIGKKISEDQWQKQTFDILLQIRKNYYHYLNEHGFSDLIFAEIEDNSQFLSGYERVVVVNQFYLTKREKHLLPQNSTIYIQLPEQLYDKKELRCSNDLTAEYLKNIRTESVELHIFSNDFSLKHHLFSYEFDLKNDLLVDTGILRDHLDHYTPMVKRSIPFTSSSIYRFFDNIHHLLSGIIIQDNILLIEINSLVKVVNDKMFLKYFTPDECNEKDVGILSEILFNWLYSLIDNDYKYVDLSLQNSVSSPPQKIRTALENMFNCLLSYRSLTQFCDFCKLLNEYKLSKIISHDECCCSDLPDIYYQMLYDFSAIAQIKIIEDWKLVFPQNNSEFATGFSLLKLFLNYSKNKVFRFLRDEYDLDIPEITSINNTRNLTCEHIIIIDAVEGNLPPARKTPFFLTEAQRAMLQLKTYSDIVLREKYYFLRLVAQSRRVSILSRVEERTTTELSSFVEELKLFQPQLFSNSASAFSTCMEDHINKWLAPATSDLISPKIPDDFAKLPFSKENDLKNMVFPLSPSSIKLLIEQPFLYYINNILKLSRRDLSIIMDFSNRQLGNIIHAAFSAVWARLIEVYQGNVIHHDFRYNQNNYAERALENYLLNSPDLVFKIPHNHSLLYFDKIIKRFISDAVEKFLQDCSAKYTNEKIKIIPEKDNDLRRSHLFTIDDIKVVTYGMADLRIEIFSSHEKHIYDYKSVKYNKYKMENYAAQLGMYEKLYYDQADNVKKYIYFVIDRESRQIDDLNQDLILQIEKSVKDIIISGYGLGEKKFTYEDEEFSRRQLIRQYLPDETL